MLSRLFLKYSNYVKLHGLTGLVSALVRRVRPVTARSFSDYGGRLAGLNGVEIGGPSRIFSAQGIFPVYPIIASLDNVTYAARTIWVDELSQDREFHFNVHSSPGKQFILDATDLSAIGDGTYDFLVSSHVLEHLANPLRGLFEWIRVVKDGGVLVIVLPHKDGTFDHLRRVTTIGHIIEDYLNNVDEHDATHLEEIRRFHDLSQDDGVSGREEFENRIINNANDRSMHHHVFSTRSMAQLLDYAGLKILSLEAVRPCHAVAIAMKAPRTSANINKHFLDSTSRLYTRSPFRTDRTEK